MDCPNCKATIDDDSWYCDQCGEEILLCPQCARPGKGKRCIFDGKPLAPARSSTIAPTPPAPATATTPPTPVATSGPPPAAAVGATTRLDAAAPALRLRLVCAARGLDFHPEDGAILGRRSGAHVAQFAALPQISGSHLQLQCTAAGQWQATDLGSTNGSLYNGTRLQARVPQAIAHGGVLTLADIPFAIVLEP